MSIYLTFLAMGIGTGAIFAALGVSLTLTYRSSGVINFATGSIALYAAYTFSLLREGKLFNPIFGLPATVEIGNPPLAVELLAAVACASILGLLSYLLVFRPLRRALPVARVVASVGLMAFLQSLIGLRLGTEPIALDAMFPSHPLSIGSVHVPGDRLLVAACVVALTLGLWAFYRFTSFGLKTRAVSDSEKGAVINGIRADLVAAANWMIAAAVAGLCGILIAPIVSLTPGGYTLLVVPALAVALSGGFTRILPPLATGLLLGMFQSLLLLIVTKNSWLPQSGLPDSLPFLVIVGYMIFRGRALPGRGELFLRAMPLAREPRRIMSTTVLWFAVAVAALALLNGGYRYAFVTSLLIAMLSLSVVLLTGYVGQISLAQLTFAGFGGYLMDPIARLAGIPFPIAPLIVAVAAAALGVVVGLPALRVRGVNLAIVTLACAVVIEQMYFLNPKLSNGVVGPQIPGPTLFGVQVGGGKPASFWFGFSTLVFLTVVAVGIALIRRSTLGSWMLAVRANERAASAAGINVAATKLIAFMLAAFIAALSGALWAYRDGTVSVFSFGVMVGLLLFVLAYLTGISSIAGGIKAGVVASGGIVYVVLSRHLNTGGYYELVTAALVIATCIFAPDGMTGRAYAASEARARRKAERALEQPVVALEGVSTKS